MTTIKLKVNDKVLSKLLWLLSHFRSDEVEIIDEESSYERNKKYLEGELIKLENGQSTMVDIEQAENRLEDLLAKYES